MINLVKRLLKKSKPPTPFDEWPEGVGETMVLNLQDGNLSGSRIGDGISQLKPFRRPDAVERIGGDEWEVRYDNEGIWLSFDERKLVMFGSSFGAVPVLVSGDLELSKGMPTSQVVEILGKPSRTDLEDVDDLSLLYDGESCVFEVVFDAKQTLSEAIVLQEAITTRQSTQ